MLGTAVGDALGLPMEGLSPKRARRIFGEVTGHRLLPGKGLVSDDTEHTCMVAQALVASAREPERFQRELARRIKHWFWMLPAGVGLATLRACLKLSIGTPPSRSGVFSAGNGPAMRSALLGLVARDYDHLVALVDASTQITHRDPRANHAAFAVALAARLSASHVQVRGEEYVALLREVLAGDSNEFIDAVARAAEATPMTTDSFAIGMGLEKGVTGYALHTVPVCLHAWFRNPSDYRQAVGDVIACGGDSDTTGAILGAIVGAAVGVDGIPVDWVRGIADWPRTVGWMNLLAEALASERTIPPELSPVAVLLRNAIFLAIVLTHGVRRLLPPY
ncbi:MAG: ADP-ribosylglycohydrolase family protein [Candidatus Hydrogenedentes bacterium]|nr:ADP-ribosylglycohydrolase family protein [Candidatus Hydrogenedentota bacterium]